jgi:hypothetical protein
MWTITAKTLGRKKPLFADWAVPPPPELGDGGELTLRELIAVVVRREVEAFRRRAEARRLDRVMTAAQIDEGAARGKVDPAGKRVKAEVDEEEAVGAAWEAFEDGVYLVVIDGQEKRSLDERVYLRPDSTIAFIRLTFLAGA